MKVSYNPYANWFSKSCGNNPIEKPVSAKVRTDVKKHDTYKSNPYAAWYLQIKVEPCESGRAQSKPVSNNQDESHLVVPGQKKTLRQQLVAKLRSPRKKVVIPTIRTRTVDNKDLIFHKLWVCRKTKLKT